MEPIRCFLRAVTLTVLLCPGAAGQAPAPPPLALFGVNVVDGRGGPPLRGVNVLIEDGRIRAIFQTGEIMLSADVEAHALPGRWVVPGLVNTHVHFPQLSASPGAPRSFDRDAVTAELERSLGAGVTTLREMAGDAPATAGLARALRAEGRAVPDVHFALVTAGESFFAADPRVGAPGADAGPASRVPGAVGPDTDLEELVGFASGLGAAGVKIYSDLPGERVRALVQEAHRQGLRAWAHATVFPTRPSEVVAAGVDGISHVCGLPWEVLPDVPERFAERPRFDPADVDPDDPRFAALFEEMWRRGTVLDATMSLYRLEANQERGCTPELMLSLASAAQRAGVPISTGTDWFNDPAAPFPSLHDEIEHLVTIGLLTPGQAITAATLNGARALGIEASHGTLERGKVADLVILEDDPTADIRALRGVVGVVKDGRIRWREGAGPSGPGEDGP